MSKKIYVSDYKEKAIEQGTMYEIYSEYIDSTIIGTNLRIFNDFGVIDAYQKDIPSDDKREVTTYDEKQELIGIQLTDEIREMSEDEVALFIAEII